MSLLGLPPLTPAIQALFSASQAVFTGSSVPTSTTSQWGIYQNGALAIQPETILVFDYKKDYSVLDYPIEQGSFSDYNKVEHSGIIGVIMSMGQGVAERSAFLATLDTLRASLDTVDVVTPEATYSSYTINSVDFKREQKNGAGMIVAGLKLTEIRTTAVASYAGGAATGDTPLPADNVASPSSADASQLGQVQTAALSNSQLSAIASGANGLSTALTGSISTAISGTLPGLSASTLASLSVSIGGAAAQVSNGSLSNGALNNLISAPIGSAVAGAVAPFVNSGSISPAAAATVANVARDATGAVVGANFGAVNTNITTANANALAPVPGVSVPVAIPLANVPSQTLQTVLGGQNCQISVYTKTTGMFLDLSVNNAPITTCSLCLDRVSIGSLPASGFAGALQFVDTQGTNDPSYASLGSQFQLMYMS